MPGTQGGETPQNTTGAGETPSQGQSQDATRAGETPRTWGEWLAVQPETVKSLYQEHTGRFNADLAALRQERNDQARQLKELQGKVEKGSDTEKLLMDMQSKLEQSERRAAFNEEASTPGVGCLNPKAAYALAVADNLFDRKGYPDWAALKVAAPELFRKTNGSVDGGNAGNAVNAHGDMNSIIRRAAGRG